MKVYFRAVCPYCQHENKFQIANKETQGTEPYIFCCDDDEGGCGKEFVVRLKLEPVVICLAIAEPVTEPEKVTA